MTTTLTTPIRSGAIFLGPVEESKELGELYDPGALVMFK